MFEDKMDVVDLSDLQERVSKDTYLWNPRQSNSISQFVREILAEVGVNYAATEEDAVSCQSVVEQAMKSGSLAVCGLGNQTTSFLATPISKNDGGNRRSQLVLSFLGAEPATAKRLLESAIENVGLQRQIELSQAALNESAMQLAQSYEEQNWLRGFARNATTFTTVASANQVAEGILQPLNYLLRSQDLFLVVLPEETERSGLVSTSYGNSGYELRTIIQVLNSYQFGKSSPPLVRNNLSLSTPEGLITSIVAVVIGDSSSPRGFLVGINRSADLHPDGTPVYDSEFGSGDVGLLEEAAVLLTT
ncbi:MAG: hypothetical protein AAGG44_14405, partial [Planctomycetota bacterium]